MSQYANPFDPLPTPEEIAGWDQASVAECGMSFLALMENSYNFV